MDAAYLIGPFAKEAINAAHEASTDPVKYKLWFPEQLDPGTTHKHWQSLNVCLIGVSM